jgi:hypothetical protein
MKDFTDRYTTDLLGDPPRRGRPPSGKAKPAAQRMREYRARLKAEAPEALFSDISEWCIQWLTREEINDRTYFDKTKAEIIETALKEAVRLRLVVPIGDIGEPIYREMSKVRKSGG